MHLKLLLVHAIYIPFPVHRESSCSPHANACWVADFGMLFGTSSQCMHALVAFQGNVFSITSDELLS